MCTLFGCFALLDCLSGCCIYTCIASQIGAPDYDLGVESRYGIVVVFSTVLLVIGMCLDRVSVVVLSVPRPCRFGCMCDESVSHVLLDCPHYSMQRSRVTTRCDELGIPVTIRNLMCHPRVHRLTESFFVRLCSWCFCILSCPYDYYPYLNYSVL